MNKPLLVMTALLVSTAGLRGQGVNALAPSAVNPKPAPSEAQPAVQTHRPRSPRSPEGDKPINPDQPNLAIRAIVIVPSREEIQEAGVTNAVGLQVRDLPFLNRPDFARRIEPFLGRRLTENTIRDLEDEIILYCRERGKVLVDVILPEQNIENGVLQLWLLEGKVGKVLVKNEGRKWFKDQFILDNVHLQPGEPVNSQELSRDLTWLNGNPFRQVDVAFKPGEKLGLTDVELQVDDRIPLRPYIGYEDSGTRFTGPERLLAGLNWGNAFGLDHQLNYQYATDINFYLVKAHSASYLIPLPWRHTLMVYGSYVDGKAEFPGGTTANGRSWQTSLRYAVPLPQILTYHHEASAGFDFKRSNNNLLFGGTNVLQNSDTDIAQFVLGYNGVAPDRYGRTSFGLELYYSPGGLTANNSDSAFTLLRQQAESHYFYGRINGERITRLPYNFSWVLTAWAQWSDERLLPSEQLALGGYNTVRGYDERVVTADNGWIVENELRTPPLALAEKLHIQRWRDELQLLAFFDCGGVHVIQALPGEINPTLYSTGVGLRYALSRNFSLRFDYGFPLTYKGINEHDSRGHLGVLLSF